MKSKSILFRADGNSSIGLGHLYRLFSLVEMLKKEYKFVFLTKETSTKEVIPSDYMVDLIPENITITEEPDWLKKKYKSSEYIIIGDGYQFNSIYQQQIKKNGFQLIYVDDLITNKMFADVIINHSPGVSVEDYLKEDYTSFALGTKYSLLRPEFLKLAKKERKIKDINSAFVCFGGADPFNLTVKAVEGLLEVKEFEKIHVVLGGAYKKKEIFELEKKFRILKIHQNLSEIDLSNVMLECNFAIAPSSTILYEICSVKMLVLSGYYVDNQKKIYEELARESIIIEGGDFTDYTTFDFKEKIISIFKNVKIEKYIKNQKKFFDGKSKARLLGVVNQLNISFVKASEEDMLMVYNWSNDSLVRKNSYESKPIELESHKKWYLSKIKSSNTIFLIALVNGEKAGVVRFEIDVNSSIVGILIPEKYRGQKLASELLIESSKLYFNKFDVPIHAYIKKENIASIKSFEKANYMYLKEECVKGSLSFVYKLEK